MTNLYLQTGAALALVIGTIYLLSRFVGKKRDKDCLMNIMGYQSLGPKKGLAVVRVGQEVILVGVTATDVKLLKNIEQFSDDAGYEKPREKLKKITAADVPVPAKLKGPETMRFDDTLASLQTPEKISKVIMADTTTNLKKLKALKDCLYAVK